MHPRCRANRSSRSRSPLGARLTHVDALEDPEPDRDAHQRRPAVRDERQRDAGDGHDPDDHPDVDERAGTGSSRRHPRANSVPNGSRDRQPATRMRHRSSTNSVNITTPPMNPSSSARTAKHEVGRLDRQEVALRLGAVREALAHAGRRHRRRSGTGTADSPRPGCPGVGLRNDVRRSF